MRWGVLLVMTVGCGGRSELVVPAEGLCGDGVVEAAEQCDLGADNTLIPALELHQGDATWIVMPIDTTSDAESFYDYRSESSHTGLEEADLSVLFLHRDLRSGVLGFGVHHGIDEDESGITLEHGEVDMDVVDVPPEVQLVVADEPSDEVFLDEGTIRGRWEFWVNSDGFMTEGLPFPGDWAMTATVEFFDGIERWRFVGADGAPIELDPTLPAILETHPIPAACRPDCLLPRCGDGFVDGGEVCDDGNRRDDDGCSADCTRVDPG